MKNYKLINNQAKFTVKIQTKKARQLCQNKNKFLVKLDILDSVLNLKTSTTLLLALLKIIFKVLNRAQTKKQTTRKKLLKKSKNKKKA